MSPHTDAAALLKLAECPFCKRAVMLRKALHVSDGNVDAIIHAARTNCGMVEFADGTTDESIVAKWNHQAASQGSASADFTEKVIARRLMEQALSNPSGPIMLGSDAALYLAKAVAIPSIEAGARAIARVKGHDPDDLAPLTAMCTGDNEQVPWWKVFEEEAEACLLLAHIEKPGAASQGRATAAQAALPPLVDRAELVGLLEDLASVNLSREAVERQARRMADDLIARGLSVPSAHRGREA